MKIFLTRENKNKKKNDECLSCDNYFPFTQFIRDVNFMEFEEEYELVVYRHSPDGFLNLITKLIYTLRFRELN